MKRISDLVIPRVKARILAQLLLQLIYEYRYTQNKLPCQSDKHGILSMFVQVGKSFGIKAIKKPFFRELAANPGGKAL